MLYIDLGKGDIIPVIGVIRDKEEVVMISFLRNKANKEEISSFVNKSKTWSLKKQFSSWSENVSVLKVSSGELTYMNSQKLDNFSNAEIVTYAKMEKLNRTIFTDSEEELTNGLLVLLKDQSPIPIPLDNNELAMKIATSLLDLSTNLSVDYSVESYPYRKAIMLDINSSKAIDKISREIVIDFGQQQFIDNFKRAPMIKNLMYMTDPKNSFKIKTWQAVLKFVGGKDKFEELKDGVQKNIIWAYEIFQDRTPDLFEHIDKIGVDREFLPFKELSIVKAKDPENFKIDLNKFFKELKNFDNGIFMFAFLASLEKEDFRNEFPKMSHKEIMAKIAVNKYRNLKPGGEGIAMVAAELMLTEAHFEKYQEKYIEAMAKIPNTPRTYPTIRGKLEGTDYSWESMDMGNPRGWFVGLETDCCQHLFSVGGACVIYAAENPKYSGMFRVMKKGKTVAQSFFWYHQESGDFVLDNIEVLGNELRKSVLDCYYAFADELEKRKDLFGYKRLTFGGGYSDISTSNFERIRDNVKLSDMPNGYGVYSDAHTQYLLKEFK